jgi:hypothetical protein
VSTRGSTDGRVEPLPPEAAVVLQLEPTGAVGDGLAGRVEHVVSGRAMRFGSLDELLAFIRRTVIGLATEQRRRALEIAHEIGMEGLVRELEARERSGVADPATERR